MLRPLSLLCSIICICIVFSAISACAAPSFDCARASRVMERLICSDADLSEQDRMLADHVSEAVRFYEGRGSNGFLAGQRRWLRLRNQACLLDTGKIAISEQKACVLSVYRWRNKEISSQLAVQRDIDIAEGSKSIVDFDRKLDEPENLSVYYPEDKSAMHYGSDSNSDMTVIPRSCREFYTFISGGWQYWHDTIGGNSETSAWATCNFKMISLQNFRVQAKDDGRFKIENISSEFSCIFECTLDERSHPLSFQNRADAKTIAIEHIADESDLTKFDETKSPPVLKIEDRNYAFEHGVVKIFGMNIGCFYRCERDEVLLRVFSYPIEGTARSNEVLLAYWDKQKKMIRPYNIIIRSYIDFRAKLSVDEKLDIR